MTSAEPARRDDVRMRGFAQRSRVSDVWQWLQDNIQPLPPEAIPVTTAAGRVLASAVTSEVDVPALRPVDDGRIRGAGGRHLRRVAPTIPSHWP